MKSKMIIFCLVCAVSFLFAGINSVCAGEVDIDFFGVSYHLDAGGANDEAPRRMSDDGVWVFNPGVGAGYG